MNRVTIHTLALAIQAQQPLITVGGPGIGKTEVTYAVCRALARKCRVIPAAIYGQEDIGGFPAPDFDRGYVRMLPNDALFHGLEDGDVVFWDELNQADEHKQGALMRVILENRAGSHQLPKVSHIAAINPPEMSAGGSDIAPPMANRFMWMNWHVDPIGWCNGALKGFPDPEVPTLPNVWKSLVPMQLALVTGYIRARQDVLNKYPKSHAEACGPWASPRTWTYVAKMDAAVQASGLDDDVRLNCFAGLIGNAQAIEYLTYLRELDLPDVEELLAAPSKFKLPSRGDQRYAVMASVVGAVVRHFSDDRYVSAWKIFDKARDGGAGDIVVASVPSLAAMHNKLKGKGPQKEIEAFLPLLKRAGIIAS